MIVDDFLSKSEADKIHKIVDEYDFRWRYKPRNQSHSPDNLSVFQFVHSLSFDDKNVEQKKVKSRYYDAIMSPILSAFEKHTGNKVSRVVRAKINLITKMEVSPVELLMMEHKDIYGNSNGKTYSLVYYIEDSDGDTVIFDNNHNVVECAPPKKGSAVIFDSYTVHRGTPPNKHKRRVILNVILEVE